MGRERMESVIDDEVVNERVKARNAMFRSFRPFQLMHNWVFWYDRYSPPSQGKEYNDRLTEIAQFNTIPDFWKILNNLPMDIASRDSIHMFKKGIQPRWEDPCNRNGGAWTFRIPRDKTYDFFVHILLLLIGETLAKELNRGDSICGVSLTSRGTVMLVSVWNRLSPGALPSSAVTPVCGRLPFSDNTVVSPTSEDEDEIVTPLENGIDKIKDFILSSLPETLKPQSWVYKA